MEYKKALRHYFGDDALVGLQKRAKLFGPKHLDKDPVTPDLWPIVDGKHQFIEVKLPGDRAGKRQLAGLALIKKHLSAIQPVSAHVAYVHPKGTKNWPESELVERLKDLFDEFYRAA